jgi:carbamoylphosphate synthase small subunit
MKTTSAQIAVIDVPQKREIFPKMVSRVMETMVLSYRLSEDFLREG